MKKFIVIIFLCLVAVTAKAQLQMELQLGIDNRDCIDSGLLLGYDFDKLPVTLGGKVSCTSFAGPYCSSWNPMASMGVFARVYTGKRPFRFNVDAIGEICLHHGYFPGGRIVERALYLQPSLSYHFFERMAIKANIFKFGVWGTRETPQDPVHGTFAARFDTYSLSFLIRF